MKQIKETWEVVDINTEIVLQEQSHPIDMETPPFSNDEEFFVKVVQGFYRKHRTKAVNANVTCHKESATKYVVSIKFNDARVTKYNKLTYELI